MIVSIKRRHPAEHVGSLLQARDMALSVGDWRTALVHELESFMCAPGSGRSTPFRHQGRNKWVGIDCVGLPVVGLKNIGIIVHDMTRYSRSPQPSQLMRHVSESFHQVWDAIVGDIAMFWIRVEGKVQHAAPLLPASDPAHQFDIIHAYDDARVGPSPGRVVRNGLDDSVWMPRLHSIWRVKEELIG